MKVFCKATIYAVKEIDDSLVGDRLEEAISDFETDMQLDIDNMQHDGNSDYSYTYDVGSASWKELSKEDVFLFKELEEISGDDTVLKDTAKRIYDDVRKQFPENDDDKKGCRYYVFDSDEKNRWALVFGHIDENSGLCGKVAYQSLDNRMSCDYDIDWTMPCYEGTDNVVDTNILIHDVKDVEWLLGECQRLRGRIPEFEEPKKERKTSFSR